MGIIVKKPKYEVKIIEMAGVDAMQAIVWCSENAQGWKTYKARYDLFFVGGHSSYNLLIDAFDEYERPFYMGYMYNNLTFIFHNKKDALMFKLKWVPV